MVNAAANHWKHSDEWDFGNLSELARGTIETLQKTGVEVSPYEQVASNVFGKMGLNKFSDLAATLTQWSKAVEAAFS